ncbi:hypothetical protein HYR54_16000 [Candidatus Acetothermia bacterium]|nr:hypothetical protein [Candidatus Acetothermia bacterium]
MIANEMGHDLGRGILDLYDIDGTSWGIGDWDLMSTGAWNGIHALGDSPAYPSAWTKWFWGWINPIPVQGQQAGLVLSDAARNAGAFYPLGSNPNGVDWTRWQVGTGEYFLIENRQNVGYDAALPGHGLLIWHIDESVEDNSDETHRLVDLEEAGETQNLDCVSRPGICPEGNQGNANDPFPGQNNVRMFNATTAPSSNFYDGKSSRTSLSNIVESDAGGVTLDAQAPGTGTPPSVNQAPTANAGPNRTVELGTPVTLDGTGSSDPDRDALQYQWLVLESPASSKIKPGKSFSSSTPRFTPDQEGHYEFKLTVDDRHGGVNSAIVEIFAVATELFHDDMESSAVIWSSSGSAQRLTRSSLGCNLPAANEKSSGEYVWYLGNPSQCIYDSSATLLSPSISVQGVIKLGLSFNYFLQLRKGDQVEVSVSFDESTRWRKLWSKPQQGSWASSGLRTLTVPNGVKSMILRFRLMRTSKFKNLNPTLGWLLDDVRVIKLSGSPSARVPGVDPNDLDQLHKTLFDGLRLPQEVRGWTARTEIFRPDGYLIDRTEWVIGNSDSVRQLLQSKHLLANGVYWVVLTLRSPEGHITRKLIPFAWLRSTHSQ